MRDLERNSTQASQLCSIQRRESKKPRGRCIKKEAFIFTEAHVRLSEDQCTGLGSVGCHCAESQSAKVVLENNFCHFPSATKYEQKKIGDFVKFNLEFGERHVTECSSLLYAS